MRYEIFAAVAVIAAVAASPAHASNLKFGTTSSSSSAGSTTVTQSYGTASRGNWTAGAGTQTIYTQPQMGGSGPTMGTQRGSTSDTSYGGMIRYNF